MELRGRLAKWAAWPGWRRTAPVAGSVAANLVIATAVIASLSAVHADNRLLNLNSLSVTLVSDSLPPPPSDTPRAMPQRPATPTLKAEQTPALRRDPSAATAASSAPSGGLADAESVYVGPEGLAGNGPPLGLKSMLEKDPCNSVEARLRGNCDSKFGKMLAKGELVQTPTPEQLKRMYPGLIVEADCGSKHLGCIQPDWISSNGTHPVGNKSPMSGGAGQLGGFHELVGRLGPPNEYHRDPGFGDGG